MDTGGRTRDTGSCTRDTGRCTREFDGWKEQWGSPRRRQCLTTITANLDSFFYTNYKCDINLIIPSRERVYSHHTQTHTQG